jgi:hypothetical protein
MADSLPLLLIVLAGVTKTLQAALKGGNELLVDGVHDAGIAEMMGIGCTCRAGLRDPTD